MIKYDIIGSVSVPAWVMIVTVFHWNCAALRASNDPWTWNARWVWARVTRSMRVTVPVTARTMLALLPSSLFRSLIRLFQLEENAFLAHYVCRISNQFQCIVLRSTVFLCVLLSCIFIVFVVLYYIVMCFIISYCVIVCCIRVYCFVLICIVLPGAE